MSQTTTEQDVDARLRKLARVEMMAAGVERRMRGITDPEVREEAFRESVRELLNEIRKGAAHQKKAAG